MTHLEVSMCYEGPAYFKDSAVIHLVTTELLSESVSAPSVTSFAICIDGALLEEYF